MARILPVSIATVRPLLLALLAIGFVLRVGGPCEAMAATIAPSVEHVACADMPMESQKSVKVAAVDCALCVALPGAAAAPAAAIAFVAPELSTGSANQLAGLSGGPAPPPPRIA